MFNIDRFIDFCFYALLITKVVRGELFQAFLKGLLGK